MKNGGVVPINIRGAYEKLERRRGEKERKGGGGKKRERVLQELEREDLFILAYAYKTIKK